MGECCWGLNPLILPCKYHSTTGAYKKKKTQSITKRTQRTAWFGLLKHSWSTSLKIDWCFVFIRTPNFESQVKDSSLPKITIVLEPKKPTLSLGGPTPIGCATRKLLGPWCATQRKVLCACWPTCLTHVWVRGHPLITARLGCQATARRLYSLSFASCFSCFS